MLPRRSRTRSADGYGRCQTHVGVKGVTGGQYVFEPEDHRLMAHRFYAITSTGVRAIAEDVDCPSDFDAMIHGGEILDDDGWIEVCMAPGLSARSDRRLVAVITRQSSERVRVLRDPGHDAAAGVSVCRRGDRAAGANAG